MSRIFKETLWRLAKDILIDREYYEMHITKKDDLLVYECADCGYIHKRESMEVELPEVCAACLGITNELGTTEREDKVWYLLNNFAAMKSEVMSDYSLELDLLHPICDCPEVNEKIEDSSTVRYTGCAYTIEDYEEIVPLCPVCDGCIFCRYDAESTDAYNTE